jgi:hypothetical protein
MIFNDLQLQAKRNGELEYAMEQAQTDMTQQQGPWGDSHKGFCAGLAFRWTWLRYGDADYQYDPQTREMDTPDWQATRDQMVYGDALKASGNWRAAYNAALQPYNMSVNNGQVTERTGSKPSGALLLQAAYGGGPGCYIITIHREMGPPRGSVSHAVAMQYEGPKRFRFFDANFGEFVLRSADHFVKFMDWFIQESNYGLIFTTATRVVGVNPPPAGAYDRF